MTHGAAAIDVGFWSRTVRSPCEQRIVSHPVRGQRRKCVEQLSQLPPGDKLLKRVAGSQS